MSLSLIGGAPPVSVSSLLTRAHASFMSLSHRKKQKADASSSSSKTRHRTPGGVFIHVLKGKISEESWGKIKQTTKALTPKPGAGGVPRTEESKTEEEGAQVEGAQEEGALEEEDGENALTSYQELLGDEEEDGQ